MCRLRSSLLTVAAWLILCPGGGGELARAAPPNPETDLIVRLRPAGPQFRLQEAQARLESVLHEPGPTWQPAFRAHDGRGRDPALSTSATGQGEADPLSWVQVASFSSRFDRDRALRRLAEHPEVVYVEPVQSFALAPLEPSAFPGPPLAPLLDTEPGDVLYPEQWSLRTIGMPGAWAQGTGTPGIVVAVLDTGIDLDHPDLVGNLYGNPAEQAGELGVDDDANGFVDDIHGWDFARDGPDPDDTWPLGHGTQVAGIIGAVSDGVFGSVGITWDVELLAVKMFHKGAASNLTAAQSLVYAVDRGAHVINNSWSGVTRSRVVREAVDYALAHGVVVVSAAGNDRESVLEYQTASFDGVIAVAATTPEDVIANFSNYGSRIDVAAPGVSIVAPVPGGGHGILNGTSAATPHVSGLVAHVLYRHPHFTHHQVRAALMAAAHDLGEPGWDVRYGAGRIDAAALEVDNPPTTIIHSPHTLDASAAAEIQVEIEVQEGTTSAAVEWRSSRPGPWSFLWQYEPGGPTRFHGTIPVSTLEEGDYVLRVLADGQNGRSVDNHVQFRVDRTRPELDWAASVKKLSGSEFGQYFSVDWSERSMVRAWVREWRSDEPFDLIRIPEHNFSHDVPLSHLLPGTYEVLIEAEDLAGLTALFPLKGAFIHEAVPLYGVPQTGWVEAARLDGVSLGAVADLDGDGRVEILGEEWNGKAATGPVVVVRFDDAMNPTRVAGSLTGLPLDARDLDLDGSPEVAVQSDSVLALYSWSALAEPRLLARIEDWDDYQDARFADIDGDGWGELVYAYRREPKVLELTGEELIPIEIVGGARVGGQIAIDDFDGDGRTEMVLADGFYNVLTVLEYDPEDRQIHRVVSQRFQTTGRPTIAVEVGDADGDGRPEFAAYGQGLFLDSKDAPVLVVFEATADNRYEQVDWLELEGKSLSQDHLASADLDGDGRGEILAGVGGNIYLLDSSGPDRYLPAWGRPRSEKGGAVLSADVDGDGTPEILSTSREGEAGPVTLVYRRGEGRRPVELPWSAEVAYEGNWIRWGRLPEGAQLSDLAVYRLAQGTPALLLETDAAYARVHTVMGEIQGPGEFLDENARVNAVYRVGYTVDSDAERFRVFADRRTPVGPQGTSPLVVGTPFPSPSADVTKIALVLGVPSPVLASVYDVQGRRVRRLVDGNIPAGRYLLEWDGRNDQGRQTASGVYFLGVRSPLGESTRRIVRIR